MKNNYLNANPHQSASVGRSIAQTAMTSSVPDLSQWQPKNISPFPIKIDKHGNWYHENTKMTRQSLVNLFAKMLWQESHDGKMAYFLKTPSDLYAIDVADVPLFINRVELINQNIVFYSTTGDVWLLGDEHTPYFAKSCDGESCAYVRVRYGLSAKIMRSAFYHLVDLGDLNDDGTALKLSSGGKSYVLHYQDTP